MKMIDECNYNNVIIKFYDGIDMTYAASYKGDEMLIFFVDNWAKERKKQKRDNTINGILYDIDICLENINSPMVAIYETKGYLMETLIVVKNKMKREFIGSWNIAKK